MKKKICIILIVAFLAAALLAIDYFGPSYGFYLRKPTVSADRH